MRPLTKKQQRVLRTIARFSDKEERPPTTRELAAILRCHVKTVYQYILALERKGCIQRRKGRIHVAPEFREDRGIPILGRVAAGAPIMAVEHREGVLSLQDLLGSGEFFAVRVNGDSMKNAGILDGDVVIVQHTPTVASGRIAVCYVGEEQEVTVKRFFVRGDYYELAPENPDYRPLRIPRTDPHLRIGGKVVGVFRIMK